MSVTETEIELAYRLLLGRKPSTEEVTARVGQHENVDDLRRTFLNSAEFEKKYDQLRTRADAQHPPTLVHLHIPKTAGTTLAEALSTMPAMQPFKIVHDDTLDELRAMPKGQRRALRYVRGHLSMGAGEALGTPYRYLSLIRRPGPRIFSFYQFIRRTRTHPTHALLTEQDMSFGDYLEYSLTSMPHRLELDNGQIRRLAGRFNPASLGQEQALLKASLHNALAPDMLFGFVEHFDAYIQMLVDEGYLPAAEVEKRNVSPNSNLYDESVAALTEKQRLIFDGYTAWDTYFYDVCAGILLPPASDS